MEALRKLGRLLDAQREVGYDLLRIYLGFGLLVRGALFVSREELVLDAIEKAGGWFWPVAIAHYVALAHLGGGLLLCLGMMTRLAALVQIPPLVGAVFFVHAGEELFSAGQAVELSGLVLFMLLVFLAFGAGRLSIDQLLRQRAGETSGGEPLGPRRSVARG